mmetsp:Transcript_38051/g.89029  ORF Transcript_38051/g.89029 Transcript_38051/m.89029 type:complete len:487 (-) Transcript_38051:116-1576(-)|eukprot:CAMPEP_0178391202 /NCGR_PEP_ID=MMETSP0689_2-20121128/11044_1 /TAXON_ID=160604 /ORGANISM="Amphidinium massartii, Strain CS-259" /LENGTH=486 /DNA_ID=CAMNT_0020011743 /DNA_START=64 /DNA_END=1524 /DNA_ORIENTATION=+
MWRHRGERSRYQDRDKHKHHGHRGQQPDAESRPWTSWRKDSWRPPWRESHRGREAREARPEGHGRDGRRQRSRSRAWRSSDEKGPHHQQRFDVEEARDQERFVEEDHQSFDEEEACDQRYDQDQQGFEQDEECDQQGFQEEDPSADHDGFDDEGALDAADLDSRLGSGTEGEAMQCHSPIPLPNEDPSVSPSPRRRSSSRYSSRRKAQDLHKAEQDGREEREHPHQRRGYRPHKDLAPRAAALQQRPKKMAKPARAAAMGVEPQSVGRGTRKESASSDSEESSSSSSSSGPLGLVRRAMASMPLMPRWPGGGMVPSHIMDLEAFLTAHRVDHEAAARVRSMPIPLQQAILSMGPLPDVRNSTRALMARINSLQGGHMSTFGMLPHMGYGSHGAPHVAPRAPFAQNQRPPGKPVHRPESNRDRERPGKTAKSAIEALIQKHGLSTTCAWMLRSLPPEKQKFAARIDPSGQVDPSGYVAEQLELSDLA